MEEDDISHHEEEENLVDEDDNGVQHSRFHRNEPLKLDDPDDHDERQTAITYRNNNNYVPSVLRRSLMFRLGYTMENFRTIRPIEKSNLNLEYETRGLSVGINIRKIACHGDQLVGIVKPIVKVHVVSLETGLYIKSKKLPPAMPVVTRPCSLKDSTMSPFWNQELIIDAFYFDVADEKSLLLFEVLDDKPSLSSSRRRRDGEAVVPTAKRIAWAYLLPIGIGGELNVGLSDDWKTSKRVAVAKNKESVTPTGEEHPPIGNEQEKGHVGVKFEEHQQHASHDSLHSHGNEESHHDDVRRSGNSVASWGGANAPSKYPWSKRSADMPLRLQLHQYREYDGLFGFLQRKIMGWPTIGSYSDRYVPSLCCIVTISHSFDFSDTTAYPNNIPEVYLQWRLQRKILVREGFLSISLGPRPSELMSVQIAPGGGLSSPAHDRFVFDVKLHLIVLELMLLLNGTEACWTIQKRLQHTITISGRIDTAASPKPGQRQNWLVFVLQC